MAEMNDSKNNSQRQGLINTRQQSAFGNESHNSSHGSIKSKDEKKEKSKSNKSSSSDDSDQEKKLK